MDTKFKLPSIGMKKMKMPRFGRGRVKPKSKTQSQSRVEYVRPDTIDTACMLALHKKKNNSVTQMELYNAFEQVGVVDTRNIKPSLADFPLNRQHINKIFETLPVDNTKITPNDVYEAIDEAALKALAIDEVALLARERKEMMSVSEVVVFDMLDRHYDKIAKNMSKKLNKKAKPEAQNPLSSPRDEIEAAFKTPERPTDLSRSQTTPPPLQRRSRKEMKRQKNISFTPIIP